MLDLPPNIRTGTKENYQNKKIDEGSGSHGRDLKQTPTEYESNCLSLRYKIPKEYEVME
jgi:hypothetical protein